MLISHIINGRQAEWRITITMLINIISTKHSACQTCLYDGPFLSVALYVIILNMTASIAVWMGSSIRRNELIMIHHVEARVICRHYG